MCLAAVATRDNPLLDHMPSDEGAGALSRSKKRPERKTQADQKTACQPTTVPTPPLEAVGVIYLSSSRFRVAIVRFCSVLFQLGKVALSTLKLSVL
jgi:hypothetical protein